MSTHDQLMTYRPMSQLLKIFVVPEIDKRVASGAIAATDLPLQVFQFRLVMAPSGNTVEINDQVDLRAKVKTTRPIAAGELLTLADIDPAECYLEGPLVDGKPAAFFLCQSSFLNFMTMFDFTPNAPQPTAAEQPPRAMRYPIAEIVQAHHMLQQMQPIAKYEQLSAENWPPGPAYYPNVLWHVHSHPDAVGQPHFADVVAGSYNETYLRGQVDFWTETKFFGDRITYIKKSVDEYLAGDYVSSIYILVPHFEGALKDYLAGAGVPLRYRFESCVADLKTLVLSRRALMFPRKVLDRIFAFIETGTFLAETGDVCNPGEEVTRHGIAHGVFKNFESRNIALKYLILLDALAYVLLHDKLLTATL
jgi:hypothetical protein